MASNISLWVDYIGDQSVPLLKGTVDTLLGTANDEYVTCKDLVDTLIRDTALPRRIINIANSAYYNHTQLPIHDIRRSVLVIGFDKIYEICLTSAIIETLIRRAACRRVYELMLQSFCAAVYAQALATKLALRDSDELFVSALLWNYGEIAFWSLSGPAAEEIAERLRDAGSTEEEAQRQLLGVTFAELTTDLCKKWNLTNLLSSSRGQVPGLDKRIECIALGHELAKLKVDVFALKTKCELIQEVAHFTKQNYFETIAFVADIMQESKQIAYLYLSTPPFAGGPPHV
jgi:hypothetical protein